MESQPETITAAARASAPVPLATVNGVSALYIILCTLVLGARMFARYSVHQRMWWDDWTMVIAWLGVIGLSIQQILMAEHGGGVRITDVPKSELAQFTKIFSDLEIVARLAIFFAKLSILLLYIRVFFPPRCAKTAFYWVIQAVIWLNFLYTVALILVVTLQCVPYGLPEGSTCVNEALVLIMASVINIISDIAVLVIPLGAVWHLQVSEKKKWGLFALFAFGALAPLASIARLGYQIPEASGPDKTVIYLIVAILATAEQVIAIVVGSVPVASAYFIRQRGRNSRDDRRGNRTVTERFKPSRESEGSNRSKRSKGAPDPFRITNATVDHDDEDGVQLHPRAVVHISAASKHDARAGDVAEDYDETHDMDHGRAYGVSTTTVQIETTPRRWP